jgi:putative ABC transport system permease protein
MNDCPCVPRSYWCNWGRVPGRAFGNDDQRTRTAVGRGRPAGSSPWKAHPEPPADRRYISVSWVAPKYFETLGTLLAAGRDFNTGDQDGRRVAIVNRAMARYYFGDDNPIGRYFRFDGESRSYEIVGVAGNAKYYEIREAAPRTIYLDAFQSGQPPATLALRSGMDPQAVAPAVRRSVRALLKTVPWRGSPRWANRWMRPSFRSGFIAMLSGAFGGLGLLLAAIGIYGVLAYTVAPAYREIGIRVALGATAGAVSRMVMKEALRMSCAGLGLGVLIAYWGRRFAASLIQNLPVESAFRWRSVR